MSNETTTSRSPAAEAVDGRILPALTSLQDADLTGWLSRRGHPRYRTDQIRRWIVERRAGSFSDMTDLPRELRTDLEQAFRFSTLGIVSHQTARDRTEKLLLQCADGELVESVLMRDPGRRTVCISTQVGCAMGCVFCASGLQGLRRSLAASEIIDQVLALNRLLVEDERITNVVVMGIGEPLANYDALLDTLTFLTSRFGLGARRITVSTVGLPARMRQFASLKRPYNLAVSLHAPTDALRTQIVPVNRGTGIQDILAAADRYFYETGRRVTYEYVLLRGVNDLPVHARQLADLLSGRNAHVNLIPMNRVTELTLAAPDHQATDRFRSVLQRRGIPVTVRKRRGADIDAACGQLRLSRTPARNAASAGR